MTGDIDKAFLEALEIARQKAEERGLDDAAFFYDTCRHLESQESDTESSRTKRTPTCVNFFYVVD